MFPKIIAGPFDFSSLPNFNIVVPPAGGKLKRNFNIRRDGLVFELVDLLLPGEKSIDQATFYERTKDNELLAGQYNLQSILYKPHLLATAWQDLYLLGPRTIWKMAKDLHCVPFLRCDNPERTWRMEFIWTEGLTSKFKLLSLHSEE